MLIKKAKIPFVQIATIGILPSFLKVLIYRWKGYKIGKGVSLGIGSVLIGKDVVVQDHVRTGLVSVIRGKKIRIERYAAIGSFTIIDCDNIRIGEDARINEQVIIGGMKTPESSFDLGCRTIVMEYSFINTTLPVTIGDDSGIGGHCLLFTHGSWLNELDGFPVTFAPITIGKSVWLPWRVFVMPGVTLGDETVVGANSLISGTFPGNVLIAGSPAKIIKQDYKKHLTAENRITKFATYLTAFKNHLNFHDLICEHRQGNEFSELVIRQKQQAYSIQVYTNDFPSTFNESSSVALVVFNVSGSSAAPGYKIPVNLMVIDIGRKQRYNSTPAGEEFAKFLSRYGIRLQRVKSPA